MTKRRSAFIGSLSHTSPHDKRERATGRPRERRPQSITAKQVSMSSDRDVSTDPRAPRVQAGPGETQSHSSSSSSCVAGQPNSSSSSVGGSREAPSTYVGMRPQAMPGFNPAASNVGYYRGGIAAAAAAAPAAGPFFHPRHSYMFEGGASLGFMGVVQQPQLQPFVQHTNRLLPQLRCLLLLSLRTGVHAYSYGQTAYSAQPPPGHSPSHVSGPAGVPCHT